MVHLPDQVREKDLIAPGLREKIRQCVNGESSWPLFIHGSTGTGKTCAALCIADHCSASYYSCNELLSTVSQAQKGTLRGKLYGAKISEETLWQEWARMPLFILDELGSREKVGDFVYNTTKQLIDIRSGKPLIVISNLNLPALATLYDDRLTSRLAAGTVVGVEGRDRRLPA